MSLSAPELPAAPPVHPFSSQLLLEANQEAIASARSLLVWWRNHRAELLAERFPLVPPQGALASMESFYSDFGPDRPSVMGCLQRARFRLDGSLDAGARFVASLPSTFGTHCSWVRGDGRKGGFTYTPILARKRDAEALDVFAPDQVDFGMGRLEWQILRVDIHDFVRGVPMMAPFAGPMSRRIREAALIAAIPDLGDPLIPGPKEAVAETAFGYTFLPLAPEPNLFGFGPGHFRSAVKQFHFLLLRDGVLEVRLAFLVSPRSEKILDLRGFDPVYSAVHVSDRLTFGKLKLGSRFHDRMDAFMLRIHGQVHHNLLEEMAPFWSSASTD